MGAPALRVSVSARRRSHSADGDRRTAILPYLDVPFQHASPRILKLMKRPANAREHARAHRGVARHLPGHHDARRPSSPAFRAKRRTTSTSLLDFLEEAQLDRVGCFAYSPVDGATANALPDPVPVEVREERRARFMEVQARISAAKLARKVGTTMRVLVDEVHGRDAIARSVADAPEIDGTVRVNGGGKLKAGAFAHVTVTAADEHDLTAVIAG